MLVVKKGFSNMGSCSTPNTRPKALSERAPPDDSIKYSARFISSKLMRYENHDCWPSICAGGKTGARANENTLRTRAMPSLYKLVRRGVLRIP